MPSRKITQVEITRHIALEGTRREKWVVDKKYLHRFEEFTEWFNENKSSLSDRILRSDANILDRFVEDRIANTGEREEVVWNQVIAEICGDSETDDDDMDEVYGSESEFTTNDATHWQYYAEQPLPTYSSLVTESDTEPEPVAVPEVVVVVQPHPDPTLRGTYTALDYVPEVVVVEPVSWVAEMAAEMAAANEAHRVAEAKVDEAHFVAVSNRGPYYIPEDTTIRVEAGTMSKLLEYANARWHTAYPGEGELLGREWDIVQAVLHSRELWTHMCCLIDRKCYDMGLLHKGGG